MKQLFTCLFLCFTLNACNALPIANDQTKITSIYLVRHAEKENDGSKDPSLTSKGIQRANHLAHLLKEVELTQIHSTPYQRTLQTAQPTFEKSGLDSITGYAGNDLEEVAEQILEIGGTHLVVGHSNTTPEMAKILTGNAVPEIQEDEFNRLYLIKIIQGQAPEIILLPYEPAFKTDQ